jgi:hypothetical protein
VLANSNDVDLELGMVDATGSPDGHAVLARL